MAKPALVIDSPDALAALRADAYKSILRGRFGNVKVALPQLSAEDNAAWTQKLYSVYFSCGCNEGKVTSTIALIGVIFWLFQQPGGITAIAWTDLVLAAIIVLAAAVAGKFAALTFARHLLTRWTHDLERALDSGVTHASDAH